MITYEQLQQADGDADRVHLHRLWIPLLFVWLLMLLTFSAPGREAPSSAGSLDAIAVIKVAVRILGVFVLGITMLRSWHHPRWRVAAQCLMPFGLYVGWSLLSTIWSPLKSVSLGQVGGLLVQVMLTFVVALRCTGTTDGSKILCHLSLAMLAYSFAVLIAHVISPETSGLERALKGAWEESSAGFVHPTAAGATASLGMVILISARLLWGWKWTRLLLIPAALIYGTLLVLAASRIAIAMAIVSLLLSFLLFSRRLLSSGVIATACIVLAGYIAIDPGLELVNRAFSSASGYARRGETDEQLRTLNGRTILWDAIWEEVKKSPLVGHGYFVTSKHGEIDVWSGPANRTAHNILLQVLASTGMIGVIMFLWGLIRPLAAPIKFLLRDLHGRKLAAFLGVIGLWYFGWGLFCETFMGPVQPESVVFFTLLGMVIGIFASGRETI